MTLRRIGWPLAAWYWRASFQADSTASEPPETKNARLMARRRELGELGRELGGRRVRERPVRVVRQLAHLLERRLAELLAVRVADLHGEEPAEHVEVALAVRVEEVGALAALDDRDLAVAVAAHRGEVQPEVILGLALQFRVRARLDRHVRPSSASGHASTRCAATVLLVRGPVTAALVAVALATAAVPGARRAPGRRPPVRLAAGPSAFPRRRAAGRRGQDGLPRARWSRRSARPGRCRPAVVDLVEMRGDDAGALISSGRLAAHRRADRERPRRCAGRPARCRARRRRRAARRAVPVEPPAAARAPLGLRHPAADESACALLAPRSRARGAARTRRSSSRSPRATSASATRSRSRATSWSRRAASSHRAGPLLHLYCERGIAALALPPRRDRPRAGQPRHARRSARRRGREAARARARSPPSACSAWSRVRGARPARAASRARCSRPRRRRGSRPPAGCCRCARRPARCSPRLPAARSSARSRGRSRTARWRSTRSPPRA